MRDKQDMDYDDPRLADQGWAGMRALLDAEMPVAPADGRRRRWLLLLFLLLALLLGGVGWWFGMRQQPAEPQWKPPIAQREQAVPESEARDEARPSIADEVFQAETDASDEATTTANEASGSAIDQPSTTRRQRLSTPKQAAELADTRENRDTPAAVEPTIADAQIAEPPTMSSPEQAESTPTDLGLPSTTDEENIAVAEPTVEPDQPLVTVPDILPQSVTEPTAATEESLVMEPLGGKRGQIQLFAATSAGGDLSNGYTGYTLGAGAGLHRQGRWSLESALVYRRWEQFWTATDQVDFLGAAERNTSSDYSLDVNESLVGVSQSAVATISSLHTQRLDWPLAVAYQPLRGLQLRGGLGLSYLLSVRGEFTAMTVTTESSAKLNFFDQSQVDSTAFANAASIATKRWDPFWTLGVDYRFAPRWSFGLSYRRSLGQWLEAGRLTPRPDRLDVGVRYWW